MKKKRLAAEQIVAIGSLAAGACSSERRTEGPPIRQITHPSIPEVTVQDQVIGHDRHRCGHAGENNAQNNLHP